MSYVSDLTLDCKSDTCCKTVSYELTSRISECSDIGVSQTPSTMGHILYLVAVWALATAWLYFLSHLAPALEVEHEPNLHFPHNLEDLQHLAKILMLYKDRNWMYVFTLFCSAYIYKQTFIIPGSALLNVLAGALFGIHVGFPLACFLTGIGATCCYLWSYWLGKDLIEYYIPNKMKMLQEKVTRNQHRLLYYLLFLRMFPVSPNWLINLSCPLLDVPVKTFVITVVLGLMPYNFLTVQAGEILGSLTSVNELIKVDTLIKLAVMACVALVPGLYLRSVNVYTET